MSDATTEGRTATDRDGRATDGSGPPTTGRGLSVALAIARAETRSDSHRYLATRRKQALLVLGGVAMLPVIGLFLLGAAIAGETVAAGEADALLGVARWWLPAVVGAMALQSAFLLSGKLVDFEARPLLLATVPDRTLALGQLAALLGGMAFSTLGPVAVLFAAFGYGANSPTAALVGGLWATLVLLSASLLGVALGLAGRVALLRVPLSTDSRELYGTVLKVGATVGFGAAGAVGGAALGDAEDSELGLALLAPSGPAPAVGHAADWLFVATPLVDTVTAAAVLSGLGVLALIPLSVAAILELAPRLWYADPAKPPDDRTTDEAGHGESGDEPGLPSFLTGGRLPRLGRTGVVVDGLVRRVTRQPSRFAYLGYYAFLPVVLGASMLAVGEFSVPTVAGGVLVIAGLWLAGGVFCLNPLGEEGTMLGQLVLSETEPATLVRARLLAGALLGAPLVTAGTALLAVDFLAPARALLLGGYWLALVPASAGLALGLGTLLPGTETRQILDAVEVRAPETLAIAAHALLVLVLADGGRRLAGAALDPSSGAALDPLLAAALAGTLALVAVLLGHGGYRYALVGLADHGRQRRPDPVFAVELATGLALAGLLLSVRAGTGVALLVDLSGLAEFAVTGFLAPYAGWATVVAAYLVLADRRESLDVRVPTPRELGTAVVGAGALLGVWAAATAAVGLFDLPTSGHALGGTATESGLALAVTVALVFAVNAPVEELLFRNVVQKRLGEALDRRTALAVATLLFALVHVPVYAAGGLAGAVVPLAVVTVAGAGFGLVYDRTGNVVAAALCHGLFNATQLVVAWVGVV